MMLTRRVCLAGMIGVVSGSVGWARERSASPRYTVTALPMLPGGDYSNAYGINDRGQIVGLSSNGHTIVSGILRDTRAVLWEDGTVRDLVGNRYVSPHAFRINQRGQILIGPQYVGSDSPASVPAPESYVLLWDKGVQHVWRQAQDFQPENLNNGGILVGRRYTGGATEWRQGQAKNLPLPPHAGSGQAVAVNEAGTIVGVFTRPEEDWESVTFRHDHGKTRCLAPQRGYSDFYPGAITDTGEIYGLFRETKTRIGHGFVWRPDSDTYEDFGVLGRNGEIKAANNRGQVVGMADQGAFLYQSGHIYDLATCIPAKSGWELYQATGINEQGWIVGNGMLHGKFRAFLLRPR